MKRLTPIDFILRANEIHNGKYDYSHIKYIYISKEGVEIKCPIHGTFIQKPNLHLNGSGCPVCGGTLKLDNTSFIKKAKLKHGDKYSYEQVDYSNNRTPISITCPIHREFMQTPDAHLRGSGCPKCGKINTSKKLAITKEEFIKKATIKHAGRYDYTKVEYLNNSTKIIITCKQHGDFEQTPLKHLQGQGCRLCAGNKPLSTEEFIRKANLKHGNKYVYRNSEYKNNKTKISITCPIHGDFKQTPSDHLSGYGCKKCANNTKLTNQEFVSKAKKIHGNKYDYKDIDYEGSKKEI